MAEIVESTGKTVEDALAAALDKLGCGRSEVTYEVVQEPSSGFLGLWGKREAHIRVTTRPVIPARQSDVSNIPAPTVVAPPQPASADEFPRPQKRFHTDLRSSARAPKPEQSAYGASVSRPPRTERTDRPERTERRDRYDRYDRDAGERPTRRYQSDRPSYDRPRPSYEERPKRENELPLIPASPEMRARAERFLSEIFGAMGLTVTLSHSDTPIGVVYNMQGENLGILIGKHGQTLDSLQYLTNLVVNKNPESGYTRIILDVEDYRARREETLTRLAGHLADKACRIGEEIRLEPMSRHERKIIHMALQDNRRVTTYSAGDNPRRYVVIVPKRRRYNRGGYEDASFE